MLLTSQEKHIQMSFLGYESSYQTPYSVVSLLLYESSHQLLSVDLTCIKPNQWCEMFLLLLAFAHIHLPKLYHMHHKIDPAKFCSSHLSCFPGISGYWICQLISILYTQQYKSLQELLLLTVKNGIMQYISLSWMDITLFQQTF